MDQEKVRYIMDYFLHVLPKDERLSIQYTMTQLKNNTVFLPFITLKDTLIKRGYISPNQDLQDLHKEGYEAFERKIATYISEKYPDKIYFNNCQKCHQLARTPFAHQCKHCGYDWH